MSAYRSSHEVVVARRRAKVARLHSLSEPTLPRLWGAVAASVSRIAAGAVGLFGAAVVVALACANHPAQATYALLASVAAATGTYALGRGIGALLVHRRSWALPPAPGTFRGDVHAELALLDAWHPLTRPTDLLARLDRPSLALPLVAVSLLGPLALHFPIAATIHTSAKEFGEWIQVSGLIVGLAHLALAFLSARYVRHLLQATATGEPLSFHREWSSALGMTVLTSCVPGIVFVAIPPLLTLITGLVLVPAMFGWAQACHRDERFAIGIAQAACLDATELHALDASELATDARLA